MASARNKDIWRTVAHSRKRFVSILVICALGVTMVCGLRAACVDLRQSADEFYDTQGLYNISVQSTLGLTEDDVTALAEVEGVACAEGTWQESTYTSVGTKRSSVDVKALLDAGLNEPYLLSGTLPTSANEVAVTEQYLIDSGASLGSTITLEESDDAVFARSEYTIVGVVIDPDEMTNPSGSIAMRASASSDYSFFVTADAVDSDVYTAVFITVENTQDLLCYSSEYSSAVAAVEARIEELSAEREAARTTDVKTDAQETIDEEEAEAQESFADAEQQLADAQAEIDSGWSDIAVNKTQLASARQEIADGEAELDTQEQTIADGRAQIADARAQVEAGYAQIEQARADVNAQFDSTAEEARSKAAEGVQQAQAAFDAGQISEEQLGDTLATIHAQLSEGLAEIEAQRSAALAQFEQQVASQIAQLEATTAELDSQEAQLNAGAEQIASARTTLAESLAEIESAEAQIAAAEEQLNEGQAELDEQTATYEAEKADALQQIADARAEVDDVEDARWYVQNRESNAAYASVESDASSIEAIGYVFPVVFIIVAVLIGLTTITRMVEEERGLIGTYKSLGYSNAAIRRKYVVYALLACLLGGILGEVLGFIAFPSILFSVFEVMYLLPTYNLSFDWIYGLGSILFFMVGIVGSAILACRAELKQTPATLMRPKAPPSGARIILEHVGFIWKRLSFLNKVTARNLLRYKKRFFMTVFGIMGCMALLICGFAIRDSVHKLSELQYEDINRYDVLAIVNTSDYDDAHTSLEADASVSSVQPISVDSIALSTNDDEESLQLFTVPDGDSLADYINLRSSETEPLELDSSGLYLTRNAAELLGVSDGDTLHIKTSSLDEADAVVAHVVDNYLGNAAYLTAGAYEDLFGEEPEMNGFYVNLTESTDAEAYTDELAERDGFLSVSGTQQLMDDYSQSFTLINTIVYVIILLAAALAFVVLFTLSNTNITERIRELATIKVLGFRHREVNHYVNKETVLLTGIGVLLGLPVGYAFSHSLTYVLKMPSIYFAVYIDPISYVYAALLTMAFAVIVALLSNRTLRKIDMIEALKSVE